MEKNTTVEIEPLIRTSLLALVTVLGVPAGVYFGLRNSLSPATANALALGSSVVIGIAVVALLLRRYG